MNDNSVCSPRAISQDEVYPIRVLSVLLECSERKLREEISNDRLSAATVSRKCILVPGWAVMRWVSQCCHESDDDTSLAE